MASLGDHTVLQRPSHSLCRSEQKYSEGFERILEPIYSPLEALKLVNVSRFAAPFNGYQFTSSKDYNCNCPFYVNLLSLMYFKLNHYYKGQWCPDRLVTESLLDRNLNEIVFVLYPELLRNGDPLLGLSVLRDPLLVPDHRHELDGGVGGEA